MPYIYLSDNEKQQMLAFLGLQSEEELFDKVPEQFLMNDPLPIGEGKTEGETIRHFEELSGRNLPASDRTSFLGGGIYDHEIPSIVNYLSGRPSIVWAGDG